jgi:hypothetical protein
MRTAQAHLLGGTRAADDPPQTRRARESQLTLRELSKAGLVIACQQFVLLRQIRQGARFTAVVEEHMSDVSTSVQKAIATTSAVRPLP